ncbi:MAG: alpha/beta hydrolase [Ruminococcus sp.]|nr:alpha/beta hydrolase [Ruminococcus sp.]
MRKILSALLAAVMITAIFSSCAEKTPKSKNLHTLYFKDKSKSKEAVATFFNSKSGKTENVEMTKTGEDEGTTTFSCEGNTSLYNMAYVTYDGIKSNSFAFNKCVSGWYNCDMGFMPYTEGEKISFKYKCKDVKLKFNGYDKTVHIWTPDDYNASSKKKYSTIYLLDGQSVDFSEPPIGHTIAETECAAAQVKSMMKTTGEKAIIAAVETDGDYNSYDYTRDDELIPNLGKMAHEEGVSKKLGNKFADFMAKTVAPYIEKHYNVYSDARHTSVEGTSLGALEAFIIAMDHPEKFGTAGIMSPSFWTYNDKAWRSYIGKKDYKNNTPFLYIYSGGKKGDTSKETKEMYKRLKEMNYPKEKLVFHYNEKGTHDVPNWRSVFAEFLEAMVFQKVEAI